MKKILSFLALSAMTCAVLVACGMSKENTPEGVAKYAIHCMSEQKLEELVDCFDFSEGQREKSLQALKEMKEAGAMGDIKIESEVLNVQEGDRIDEAVVTVRMTYSNGEQPDEEDIELVKKDGEWKIKRGLFN